MGTQDDKSVETTLRIMAGVMKNRAMQFDITPEFLEEVADEIKHLRAENDRLSNWGEANKKEWGHSHIVDGGIDGTDTTTPQVLGNTPNLTL